MKKIILIVVVFAVFGFISLGFTLINKNNPVQKPMVKISKVETKNTIEENEKIDYLQSKSNKELASFD